MRSSLRFAGFRFAAWALAAALPLSAQAAPAKGASAPAGGGAPSEEHIGDWTVACTTDPSPNPCEMSQGVARKDTGQRLLNISFVYLPSRDQNFIVLLVPLGVSIPDGLVLKTDAFTSPKLPYHMCNNNGCMATLPIDKQTLQTLGTTGNASVKIADSSRPYELKLSLNGFARAEDRLVELAKAKAVNPPAAPAPQAAAPAGQTPDTSVIK